MAIRWVSTPESIKANQPSVLAIVETLAAMGIAVWIAVTWDTYVHIAIGAFVAPLLLMRTDESCIRAAIYAERLVRGFLDPVDLRPHWNRAWKVIAFPLAGVIAIALFPAARFAAWIVSICWRPVASIAAIPSNWRHLAMVLDSRQSPHVLQAPSEIPPGINKHWFPTIGVTWDSAIRDRDRTVRIVACCLLVPVAIPAYAYRWSIKSTAIIWFPLLWAMRSVKGAAGPLQPYLAAYRRDSFTKIVLWVSVVVLASFIIKLVLHYELTGFVELWNEGPLREVLSLYVAPAEIPRWQLAIAINSAIAIGMYILAGHWQVWLEHGRLTNETWPRRVFQAALFIRPILSCYTIACTLYITIIAAWDLEWPALGEQWFPWQ